MTDPLDDLLRDALTAEGERATPSGGAAPAVAARARAARRRRSAALVSTAAAVVAVLVAGGVAVVDDGGDGGDAGDISVDTSAPTQPASTESTAESSTTAVEETTPSTVPDDSGAPPVSTTAVPGDEPSRPTDAWPLPDPRSTPPEQLVAVTDDGRLVVVDTATGAEVRELARRDDPRPPLAPDEPAAARTTIDGLDVSPSGSTVRFSTCCEPISGAPYVVPFDGSGTDEPAFGGGYAPDYGASDRYVASVDPIGVQIDDPVGDFGLVWQAPAGVAGNIRSVAWALDGQTVAITTGPLGELFLLDVTGFLGAESETTPFTGHVEPVALPGSDWSLPSFRRDGALVVVEHHEDTHWSSRTIDVATGDVLESFEHPGIPASQDHDTTGEWLAVVEGDTETGVGPIHWFGPDGSTGVVPGRYLAAAW